MPWCASTSGKPIGAARSDTYEAEFRQVPGGAFVVSHRHERTMIVENGALTLWNDEEAWLEEIDLLTRPEAKTFTIDGLELPTGAPIHDETNGRHYRYGIDAVDEDDIDVSRLFGPMSLLGWLMYVNIAVGGAALVWFGRWLGRRWERPAGRTAANVA